MKLRELFGIKVIRPQIGDRVKHRNTLKLGTVQGTAMIHGSIKVPALTVAYDDGVLAVQVPENEFIKVANGG